MLEFIGGIVVMSVVIFIFSQVRGLIVKRTVKTTTNTSIGKKFKLDKLGNRIEVFDGKKFFTSVLNIFDLKLWAKSITFFIRHMLLISVIVGAVYGYGWWKGKGDNPIKFNPKEEWTFEIPKGVKAFHKPMDSSTAYWVYPDGKRVAIKVKDMPDLNKLVKPIGLEFTPIVVGGYGVGSEGGGLEAGAGISFLRAWKYRAEAFLTSKGIYVGVSYKISKNSGLGLGVGKGWTGDNRAILYWRIEF